MSISTSTIGIDQTTGQAVQYIPPNVSLVPPVPTPPSVAWGSEQTFTAGTSLPAGTGTWLVVSGTLAASGAGSVVVRAVTITGATPPPP